MKFLPLLLLTGLMLCLSSAKLDAVVDFRDAPHEAIDREFPPSKAAYEALSKRERRKVRRAARKQMRKDLRQLRRDFKDGTVAASESTILLVILAILLPPLAMYLYEGDLTNRFWISLILTLLFFIPGMIYTLIVILGETA